MDTRHAVELKTYATNEHIDDLTPDSLPDSAFTCSSNPDTGESMEMTAFTPMTPEPNLMPTLTISFGGSTFFAFPRHRGTPWPQKLAENLETAAQKVTTAANKAAHLATGCIPKN